jgi:hypothetical protein
MLKMTGMRNSILKIHKVKRKEKMEKREVKTGVTRRIKSRVKRKDQRLI